MAKQPCIFHSQRHWRRNFLNEINHRKEDPSEEQDTDPYNVLMRELAFEIKRGKAQERLKTEEEIIAEERDRLEKLEADRIKRMKGGFDAEVDGEDDEEAEVGEEENGGDGDDDGVGSDGEEEEEVEEEEGESDDEDEYSDLVSVL